MCTTMIITRGATADGSMVVAHSDDDELSDQRVIRVPAGDHPAGSRRAVMPESYPYPRMVTSTATTAS
jgi:dipeptidase